MAFTAERHDTVADTIQRGKIIKLTPMVLDASTIMHVHANSSDGDLHVSAAACIKLNTLRAEL